MTCTTLDHVYPATAPGTPCYCGKRTWAGAPATHAVVKQQWTTATGAVRQRRVKVGDAVRVLGQLRVVTEAMRSEDCYRVGEKVNGRTLFERAELEVVK